MNIWSELIKKIKMIIIMTTTKMIVMMRTIIMMVMMMMMMSIVERASSIGRITRVHKSIYAREKRGDVGVNRAVGIRRSSLLILIDSIGEDRRCRLLISAA